MGIVSLLDFLFPKKCAGCGKFGTYFCVSCIQSSKLYFPQSCPRCERSSVDGAIHVQCGKRFSPDGLTSIWAYEKAPRELILKLKYKYVTDVGLSLAVPASGTLKNIKRSTPASPKWTDKLVLVPIPLHWTRNNWRGFNHVEEVGKILAQLMGWQMTNLLVRSKMAKQQVGLKGKERKENVQNVFTLISNSPISNLSTIVLFDDVWTTGATMLEAVKVLKKVGFKRVWCLTLAR
ncbi:MAG: amidophosphoribosyltransferase [Microgenomates group bacterium Gr01-1014_5]|nr:MAG: amidophosphoribosyltransferase [Microgenomates group bacterium Gr01-1014_5]